MPYLVPRKPTEVLRAAPKYFRSDRDPSRHGVGLFVDTKLVQFLTEAQALELANQLADAVAQQAERRKKAN